ncbi:MarR family winged helix-turn-helix transcriptional regulator [Polymorphospora rubra]|uniref:Transcriptional regulator n=1 Tax=Polymorphospora rubra TaxID=338584 RepID=A0A810NB84_9ACTN|nr:MarR family winged helix-turn-helix transcriptional regulator [Polymorphospora rubra]BCJ70350.1 transcriptional regulator [Polymorphospora rubra]
MTRRGAPPRLIFGLVAAEKSLRRWIEARSGGRKVGAAGAGVLFHVARHDGALVSEVAAALGGSVSGVSGLLSRLAASGLLVKATDPADARAVRLHLTDAGRETLVDARTILAELDDRLTAGFTPAELRVVARWLDQVRALPANPPDR